MITRTLLAALVLSACSLLPAMPARADLDFGQTEHADRAKEVWAQLPSCLRDIHGTVSEVGEPQWKANKALSWSVGHADAAGAIVMRQAYWDPAYLIHEIGHVVWWQRLSEADRAEWARFWRDHSGRMPRDYAHGDAAEGWADCFSVVYQPAGTPSVDLGSVGPGVAALIRRLAEKGDRP